MPMEANTIVLEDTAGDVVVLVGGRERHSNAPTLRERLEEALDRGGGIVVDLTAATFVDSSVLGALLDARRRALEAKQGFVVCVGETVEPGVQRILDITGLVPVLPVLRRRDEAIERRVRTHERMSGRPGAAHDAGAAEGVGVVRRRWRGWPMRSTSRLRAAA